MQAWRVGGEKREMRMGKGRLGERIGHSFPLLSPPFILISTLLPSLTMAANALMPMPR